MNVASPAKYLPILAGAAFGLGVLVFLTSAKGSSAQSRGRGVARAGRRWLDWLSTERDEHPNFAAEIRAGASAYLQ